MGNAESAEAVEVDVVNVAEVPENGKDTAVTEIEESSTAANESVAIENVEAKGQPFIQGATESFSNVMEGLGDLFRAETAEALAATEGMRRNLENYLNISGTEGDEGEQDGENIEGRDVSNASADNTQDEGNADEGEPVDNSFQSYISYGVDGIQRLFTMPSLPISAVFRDLDTADGENSGDANSVAQTDILEEPAEPDADGKKDEDGLSEKAAEEDIRIKLEASDYANTKDQTPEAGDPNSQQTDGTSEKAAEEDIRIKSETSDCANTKDQTPEAGNPNSQQTDGTPQTNSVRDESANVSINASIMEKSGGIMAPKAAAPGVLAYGKKKVDEVNAQAQGDDPDGVSPVSKMRSKVSKDLKRKPSKNKSKQ